MWIQPASQEYGGDAASRFLKTSCPALLRKTDTSHKILPARIRTKVVKHRHCKLYDPEYPLLIRLLEAFEGGSQVAKADIDDGNVKWRNVLALGHRVEFVEDVQRLRPLACQRISTAQLSLIIGSL